METKLMPAREYVDFILASGKEIFYISGAISKYIKEGDFEWCIQKFKTTKEYLMTKKENKEKIIFSPLDLFIESDELLNKTDREVWNIYMLYCLEVLINDNTKEITFHPDWKDSEGARIEMAVSKTMNKKIIDIY